jgi:serine/threonine protein kinase/tetratricopeptide (TPR) repeat protein
MYSLKWNHQDWEFVGEALLKLEATWRTKKSDTKLSEFVPDTHNQWRQRTLIELIKVDQEHRWKCGQEKRLEDYLKEWPELADEAQIETDLLEAECMTRAILGDLPELEELRQRFPLVCDRIDWVKIKAERNSERGSGNDGGRQRLPGTTCDYEPSEHLPLIVGQQLGHYQVRQGPVKGGMGLVYRAYDPKLRREVALKIPQSNLIAGAKGRQRFFREARAAAAVEYDTNVCPIYEVGEIDGIPYITMAWIEGLPLGEHIKSAGIAPRDAAELVRKLASALSEYHKKGVIHRDIKPSNVMIKRSGEPFLMDFGLARLAHDTNQPPGTGSFVGTLPYMSPEQIDGGVVGKQTDLYSLGVLFYELLTGRLPFSGATDEIRRSIVEAEPLKPRDCCPGLDEGLEAICLKCMAKGIDDRFQSAGELARALRAYLNPTENHFPQKWVHATTEDEQYVAPSRALAKLDEFADRSEIRVLTVTGVGGCGKTALVTHWLKNANINFPRPVKGIFFWSFGANRSVEKFLDSLLSFAEDELDYPCDSGKDYLQTVLELLNTEPLIVVMDGFEECQEGPNRIGRIVGDYKSSRPELHQFIDSSGNVPSGRIRDSRLSDLLEATCECARQSLIVITSRYPILELPSSADVRVGSLNADDIRLDEKEGVELLEKCEMRIRPPADPTETSIRCGGHPVVLRVIAAASKRTDGDVQKLLFEAIPAEPGHPDKELAARLGRIAQFYEEHLPRTKASLLKIISLFSIPVTDAVIRQLATEIPVFQKTIDDLPDDEGLRLYLTSLCEEGLIHRTTNNRGEYVYLCHPVLREHFCRRARQESLGPHLPLMDTRPRCPDYETFTRVQLVAIQSLLESGDVRQADDLMRKALDDGRLFLEAGELEVGKMCVCEFVRDKERQEECKAQLSEERLVYYLRMAGLFVLLVGQPDRALSYGDEALRYGTRDGSLEVLLNHSLIWSLTGHPHNGERFAQAGLELSKKTGDDEGEQHSLTCLAFSLYLQGYTARAEECYVQAEQVGTDSDSPREAFNGADVVLRALYLLRVGNTSKAKVLVERELLLAEACDTPGADFERRPRCEWLLGVIEAREGNHLRAIEYLSTAERVMQQHHSVLLLPFIVQAKADVYRRMKNWDKAERYCDEALNLSATRQLALVHAESQILRGRICLERTLDENCNEGCGWKDIEWYDLFGKTMRYAGSALSKAENHQYRWLKREALLLLADAEEAAAQHFKDAAIAHRHDAKKLEKELLPKY